LQRRTFRKTKHLGCPGGGQCVTSRSGRREKVVKERRELVGGGGGVGWGGVVWCWGWVGRGKIRKGIRVSFPHGEG